MSSVKKRKKRRSLVDRVTAAPQGSDSRASVQVAIETNAINELDEETGFAPIHQACTGSSNKVVNLILQLANAGADLNLQDIEGNTPLHFACVTGNINAANALLKFKVDCSVKNKRGKTALQIAENEGEEELAKLLKQEAEAQNNDEKTTNDAPPCSALLS